MNPKDIPIRYFGDFNPGTGYNVAARGYAHALRQLGYSTDTMRLIPALMVGLEASDVDRDDWTNDYMHGDWLGDDSQDKVNIVHLNPGAVGDYWTPLGGRYNIAITTWETDRLPMTEFGQDKRTVGGDLNKYDEIWVPCRFVKEMFIRCGVEKPIFVIPHVLLPEFPLRVKEVGRYRKNKTVFYTIGTWNARKDLERVLHAYFTAGWNPLSGTILQLFSVPPTRNGQRVYAHGWLAQQALERIRASSGDEDSLPSHGLHTIYVPYSQVGERHLGSDVFVTASHGEGFCLPALEAAACGNWIIGGGPWLEELAGVAGKVEDGGLIDLLPAELVPITPMPEVRGYELDQQWWNTKLADLRDAMKAAHEARQDGEHQRVEAAARVREAYSPQAIAKLIAPRMEHVAEVMRGAGW